MYKSEIHSITSGDYRVNILFYGENPYGPRGGRCGNAVNARNIVQYSGPGSYGSGVQIWMIRLKQELEALQLEPGTFRVEHVSHSSKYKIVKIGS